MHNTSEHDNRFTSTNRTVDRNYFQDAYRHSETFDTLLGHRRMDHIVRDLYRDNRT